NDCSCSIPQCFGKGGNDTSVCSGKGTCIGKDKCKCKPKYTGKECTKDRFTASNPIHHIMEIGHLNILGLIFLITQNMEKIFPIQSLVELVSIVEIQAEL